MAIIYSWKLDGFRCADHKDLKRVLRGAWWQLTARDGAAVATRGGHVEFGEPDGASFIDYDDLTPAQIEMWAAASIPDLDKLKRELAAEVKVAAVDMPPPWVLRAAEQEQTQATDARAAIAAKHREERERNEMEDARRKEQRRKDDERKLAADKAIAAKERRAARDSFR